MAALSPLGHGNPVCSMALSGFDRADLEEKLADTEQRVNKSGQHIAVLDQQIKELEVSMLCEKNFPRGSFYSKMVNFDRLCLYLKCTKDLKVKVTHFIFVIKKHNACHPLLPRRRNL